MYRAAMRWIFSLTVISIFSCSDGPGGTGAGGPDAGDKSATPVEDFADDVAADLCEKKAMLHECAKASGKRLCGQSSGAYDTVLCLVDTKESVREAMAFRGITNETWGEFMDRSVVCLASISQLNCQDHLVDNSSNDECQQVRIGDVEEACDFSP